MTTKTAPLFNPVGRVHAIVETIFSIQFSGVLVADQLAHCIEQLKAHEGINKFFYSPSQPIVELEFEMTETGPVPRANPVEVGLNMTRVEDNKLTWTFVFNNNNLSLHTFKYTRWDTEGESPVWPVAREFLNQALIWLSEVGMGVSRFSLKTVDDFRLNASAEYYNINELFNPDTAQRLLPPNIFQLKLPVQWHSQNGWFEPYPSKEWGDAEILSQLNVFSDFRPSENAIIPMIRIEHSSSLSLKNRSPMKEDSYLDNLNTTYNSLHLHNKKLVGDLLTQDMKDRIGLVVDRNERSN